MVDGQDRHRHAGQGHRPYDPGPVDRREAPCPHRFVSDCPRHYLAEARRGASMALTVTAAGGLCLLAGVLMIVLAFWTSGQFFIEKAYTLLVFAGIALVLTLASRQPSSSSSRISSPTFIQIATDSRCPHNDPALSGRRWCAGLARRSCRAALAAC